MRFPGAGVFASLGPQARGAWYYLGYWGAGGIYRGFVNVFFAEAGLSPTEIGLLSALAPLLAVTLAPFLAVTLAPPVAGWADRRATRVLLVSLVLAGMGASMIALLFAHGFALVLCAYALLDAFTSVVPPLADGLVARMAVRHGLEFGQMRLWGSVGFAVTSAVFGLVWERVGYAPMFLVGGALFLALAPVARSLEEGISPPARARFSPLGAALDPGTLTVLALSLVRVTLALAVSVRGLGVAWAFGH